MDSPFDQQNLNKLVEENITEQEKLYKHAWSIQSTEFGFLKQKVECSPRIKPMLMMQTFRDIEGPVWG